MNRRRMMMSGKPKPLFVFKLGGTLQNYSEIKRKSDSTSEKWSSADSYIEYRENPQKLFLERGSNVRVLPTIRIAIPLKKAYSKLFVTARSPDSGGEPNAETFNSYISWSTAADGFFYDKTLLQDEEANHRPSTLHQDILILISFFLLSGYSLCIIFAPFFCTRQ